MDGGKVVQGQQMALLGCEIGKLDDGAAFGETHRRKKICLGLCVSLVETAAVKCDGGVVLCYLYALEVG